MRAGHPPYTCHGLTRRTHQLDRRAAFGSRSLGGRRLLDTMAGQSGSRMNRGGARFWFSITDDDVACSPTAGMEQTAAQRLRWRRMLEQRLRAAQRCDLPIVRAINRDRFGSRVGTRQFESCRARQNTCSICAGAPPRTDHHVSDSLRSGPFSLGGVSGHAWSCRGAWGQPWRPRANEGG